MLSVDCIFTFNVEAYQKLYDLINILISTYKLELGDLNRRRSF